MKTISTIQEFRKWRKGITGPIGFVPTMGALHAGHLSLVKKSIATCQNTIVSIYLNPAQFVPGEDLNRYPKTIDKDIKKLSYFQISYFVRDFRDFKDFCIFQKFQIFDPNKLKNRGNM